MSKGNVLAALLGGAALGAVLALLFAPAKGSDTRTRIAETLREHGVKLDKESLDKLVDSLEEKFGRKAEEETEAEEE